MNDVVLVALVGFAGALVAQVLSWLAKRMEIRTVAKAAAISATAKQEMELRADLFRDRTELRALLAQHRQELLQCEAAHQRVMADLVATRDELATTRTEIATLRHEIDSIRRAGKAGNEWEE